MAYLLAIVVAIVAYKIAFLDAVLADPFFAIYGLVVVGYLVSRFGIALLYRAPAGSAAELPAVAIVMPAFNEEAAIATSLRSLLAVDYPAALLEIVAVNDGSTDRTAEELDAVAAAAGGRINVIHFARNRGKRAAMAAGIRATSAEVVAFVDSDSTLEPEALARLVRSFADPAVGAVCGHADVQNVSESWLTKMQAVRYFVAFRIVKAAESVFGAVTCCSGCFSAYRRTAILPHLEWWESQRFLGRLSTFGDDRSLTNCVLRDWSVVYDATAVSHTIVPTRLKQFIKQQTRWKRSWTRESLIVARFIWRKHPLAALAVYTGIVLPLIAPITVLRATVWHPLVGGLGMPVLYVVGVYAMALVYSLTYAVMKRRFDALWLYGVAFVFFYLGFLVWQTYYAILTARSSSWGTRPATAGAATAFERAASPAREAA
ncbi:MAG TPA: glycosyltransferase family 2 protein [Baekduia sp.]|uniref:glycosyltransferase family 2 protein n=1 Tax=Baekduia sp. TaxID=2600305 RepID=UPI002D79ED07|nr:glycosyltransferase family 2 protein [Baekduia sp.]HET6505638.1 glycosyltransferase family 2 protein [Baekduia sp.]